MKRFAKRVSIAALAVLCAGCVTAVGTSYGPADAKGFGYEDTKVEDNRYRVTFRGDGATPASVVEDYAMLRAAEIGIAGDFDWMRVIGRDLQGQERGGVGLGAGFGTGSYGRGGGVSVGVGSDLGTVGAKQFYTARLEVLFGRGDAPEGTDTYDVDDVADNIRLRLDNSAN